MRAPIAWSRGCDIHAITDSFWLAIFAYSWRRLQLIEVLRGWAGLARQILRVLLSLLTLPRCYFENRVCVEELNSCTIVLQFLELERDQSTSTWLNSNFECVELESAILCYSI